MSKGESDKRYKEAVKDKDMQESLLNPQAVGGEGNTAAATKANTKSDDGKVNPPGSTAGKREELLIQALARQKSYNESQAFHCRCAKFLVYSIIFLAVVTTSLSVQDESIFAKPFLKHVVLILPILTTFLTSLDTSYSPLGKYYTLREASARLQSQIFRFCTRVQTEEDKENKPGPEYESWRYVHFTDELNKIHNLLGDGYMQEHAMHDVNPEEIRIELKHKSIWGFLFEKSQKYSLVQKFVDLHEGLKQRWASWENVRGMTTCQRCTYGWRRYFPKPTQQRYECMQVFTGDDYVEARVRKMKQVLAYQSIWQERTRAFFKILILVAAMWNSILAAFGYIVCLPILISISAGLQALLNFERSDFEFKQINSTRMDLANIDLWWSSLTDKDKGEPKQIYKLVNDSETAILACFSSPVTSSTNMVKEIVEGYKDDVEHQQKANAAVLARAIRPSHPGLPAMERPVVEEIQDDVEHQQKANAGKLKGADGTKVNAVLARAIRPSHPGLPAMEQPEHVQRV